MLNISGVDGFLFISVETEWSAKSISVSMATHNLENNGGVPTKICIYPAFSAVTDHRKLNLVPNKYLVI